DAVFGALDVVVHRFGNGDDRHAGCGKGGREGEGCVASAGDEAADAEAFEIFEDDGREVVILAVERKFFDAIGGDGPGELRFDHFARVGARGVQDSAAGAVNGAGVFAIERANVGVGGIRGIHVREAFPAFADADDGAAEFRGAIDDGLDDGIQAGHVAAAGEDGDFVFCGHWVNLLRLAAWTTATPLTYPFWLDREGGGKTAALQM